LKINYEKPIDTKCQYDEDCQSSYSVKDLIRCDKLTQTCQCYNENISNIDISGVGRLCTDSIDQSNCTKFPRRCLKWCDESETSHCLCPKLTRKVRRINGVFDCELEPTGICQFDNDNGQVIGPNIRKCPTGKKRKFHSSKNRFYSIIGTYCDGDRCRPSTVYRQIYEEIPNEPLISSTTTSMHTLLSSTHKQINHQKPTTVFVRTLIVIAIAILLFFILIMLLVTILIKSHRFRITSTSSEDKVSSSSYAQSTSTAMSNDSPINTNYHHQLEQQQEPSIPTMKSIDYKNYLTKTAYVHGLVPQSNLSPRFHRQQQTIDDKRRIPLHIRSPSLSRINPFIDHVALTTNEHLAKKRSPLPKVTRLQNGDVIILA
jgi:hypothetical protein